jgi:thiol:disulfide interchange protein DsbA
MQRRDLSRSLLAAGALAASGLGLSPAWAQRVGFQEGRDFVRLSKPVPVSTPPGQVEVVEFFAYSCIHCHHFEPLLDAWIRKLPADVKVRRVPVAFNTAFVPMQRLYFALESMGLVDSLHQKVFKAFHEERLPLTTAPAITAWVEKQGVDREKFTGFFNGSAIRMAEAAIGLQNAYDVEGTPALGVAGRFYISGQGPRTMLIADSLIAEARKT